MPTIDPSKLNNGDLVMCDKGTSPGTFRSLNESGLASASETKLMLNIPLFGMCTAGANPQTSANMAVSQGANAAGQCHPVIVTQWLGGKADEDVGAAAVCVCAFGGQIRKP